MNTHPNHLQTPAHIWFSLLIPTTTRHLFILVTIRPNCLHVVDRVCEIVTGEFVHSDQTDPYNRSPLTLDQVIPNPELRLKIQDWIQSKRQSQPVPHCEGTTPATGSGEATSTSESEQTSSAEEGEQKTPPATN